ncbi:hypothetical protein ACHAPJ_000168 [Fusarium lateritium]
MSTIAFVLAFQLSSVLAVPYSHSSSDDSSHVSIDGYTGEKHWDQNRSGPYYSCGSSDSTNSGINGLDPATYERFTDEGGMVAISEDGPDCRISVEVPEEDEEDERFEYHNPLDRTYAYRPEWLTKPWTNKQEGPVQAPTQTQGATITAESDEELPEEGKSVGVLRELLRSISKLVGEKAGKYGLIEDEKFTGHTVPAKYPFYTPPPMDPEQDKDVKKYQDEDDEEDGEYDDGHDLGDDDEDVEEKKSGENDESDHKDETKGSRKEKTPDFPSN